MQLSLLTASAILALVFCRTSAKLFKLFSKFSPLMASATLLPKFFGISAKKHEFLFRLSPVKVSAALGTQFEFSFKYLAALSVESFRSSAKELEFPFKFSVVAASVGISAKEIELFTKSCSLTTSILFKISTNEVKFSLRLATVEARVVLDVEFCSGWFEELDFFLDDFSLLGV
uniref:Uncharacterized protein n=1 Tax=Glossina austeni TaxID=7395 RepID=A0A1A9V7U9_GLOAU